MAKNFRSISKLGSNYLITIPVEFREILKVRADGTDFIVLKFHSYSDTDEKVTYEVNRARETSLEPHKVSSVGQFTFPKNQRKLYGVRKGWSVRWELSEDETKVLLTLTSSDIGISLDSIESSEEDEESKHQIYIDDLDYGDDREWQEITLKISGSVGKSITLSLYNKQLDRIMDLEISEEEVTALLFRRQAKARGYISLNSQIGI